MSTETRKVPIDDSQRAAGNFEISMFPPSFDLAQPLNS